MRSLPGGVGAVMWLDRGGHQMIDASGAAACVGESGGDGAEPVRAGACVLFAIVRSLGWIACSSCVLRLVCVGLGPFFGWCFGDLPAGNRGRHERRNVANWAPTSRGIDLSDAHPSLGRPANSGCTGTLPHGAWLFAYLWCRRPKGEASRNSKRTASWKASPGVVNAARRARYLTAEDELRVRLVSGRARSRDERVQPHRRAGWQCGCALGAVLSTSGRRSPGS